MENTPSTDDAAEGAFHGCAYFGSPSELYTLVLPQFVGESRECVLSTIREPQREQDFVIFGKHLEFLHKENLLIDDIPKVVRDILSQYLSDPIRYRKTHSHLLSKQGFRRCPDCGFRNHHKAHRCQGCAEDLRLMRADEEGEKSIIALHDNASGDHENLGAPNSNITMSTKKKALWKQKCGKCGQIRRGHTCTVTTPAAASIIRSSGHHHPTTTASSVSNILHQAPESKKFKGMEILEEAQSLDLSNFTEIQSLRGALVKARNHVRVLEQRIQQLESIASTRSTTTSDDMEAFSVII